MKPLPGFTFDAKRGLAHFEVCIPGTRGRKRRRRTVEVTTRPKALEEWKKFGDEVAVELAGATPAAERTLRWYFDTYWPKMKMSLSEKGRASVEHAMRGRVLPNLGDVLLDRINDAELGDFVAALRAPGARGKGKDYATESINGALSVVRKFLRDAVAREVIDRYPIRRRLPRLKTEKLRLEFTPDEKRAFLGAFDDEAAFRALLPEGRRFGVVVDLADGRRVRGVRGEGLAARYHFERFRWLRPLFVVALETGLSRGDLLRLRWASVKDGWIRVARRKTGEESVVAISSACAGALEECRARRAARTRSAAAVVILNTARKDRSAELVFTNEEGRPSPRAPLSEPSRPRRHSRGSRGASGSTTSGTRSPRPSLQRESPFR